jgi:flagellar basal body-associated protein FliL
MALHNAQTFLGVNGMSYLKDEKSSFMPIFMGLSIVAIVGFGLMYFMFGKTLADSGDAQSASTPTAPAAVQTMAKPTHSHV